MVIQTLSLYSGVRPFGVSLLMAGWDEDEDRPYLYQCDPSVSSFNPLTPTDRFSSIHNNEWKNPIKLLSVEFYKFVTFLSPLLNFLSYMYNILIY